MPSLRPRRYPVRLPFSAIYRRYIATPDGNQNLRTLRLHYPKCCACGEVLATPPVATQRATHESVPTTRVFHTAGPFRIGGEEYRWPVTVTVAFCMCPRHERQGRRVAFAMVAASALVGVTVSIALLHGQAEHPILYTFQRLLDGALGAVIALGLTRFLGPVVPSVMRTAADGWVEDGTIVLRFGREELARGVAETFGGMVAAE
jgi:hypothetical protein